MKNKNMSYWVLIYRLAWGLLLVVLIVGLVCIFLPKCHRLNQLDVKKRELIELNRERRRQIDDLKMKQERFKTDPAFVERTARNEGMVKPNEVVFRFTNQLSGTSAESVEP